MTIDERLEFLTQSVESRDRQLGELTDKLANLAALGGGTDARIKALTTRLDKLAEITQLNFDRLAQAMLGLADHVADHGRRITGLEGRA